MGSPDLMVSPVLLCLELQGQSPPTAPPSPQPRSSFTALLVAVPTQGQTQAELRDQETTN